MRGTTVLGLLVGCVVSTVAASGAGAANLVVFDDALHNGFAFTQPPKSSIDTTLAYEGSASVKITPAGSVFDQVGFIGGGSSAPVPADATTFSMAIYVSDPIPLPTPVIGAVSGFILQLGDPTYQGIAFNNSNGILAGADSRWALDGLPGTTTFTTNTWHVVTFDLPAAFGANFVPGTTQMLYLNVQATGDEVQRQINLDSAAFVGPTAVPEPVAVGSLALAGLVGLARRRR